MGFLPPLDVLARVPLAPVMLWQGANVRRNALILPEAEGPRAGQCGEGPELRVLILGDSSGAGVGVAHQSEALSGQLVEALGAHYRLRWRLIAKTGATTRSATQMLLDAPVDHYDVAILALGVNDAVRLRGLSRWRAQQAALRRILRSTFGVRRILVTGVPPIGLFPALPALLQWVLGAHAQRMDAALQQDLSHEADALHVALDLPFTREAMAADGYHPSAGTYRVWAQTLARLIANAGNTQK